MVGDDVVDLQDRDADPQTFSARFDERVFTTAERRLARRSARLRWSLWACKEAAYKALRQIDSDTLFSPRRFEVEVDIDGAGARVRHGRRRLRVDLLERGSAIHAVAVIEADFDRVMLRGLRRLLPAAGATAADAPGRAARRLARERVARHLGLSVAALEVRRIGRIPSLWCDGQPLADLSLSLSHHGAYVSFACSLGALPAPGPSPVRP